MKLDLGLGFQRNLAANRIPSYSLLDQILLSRKKIASYGTIYDEKGSLNAQLVKMPCGVSSGTGKLTFSDLTDVTINSSGGTSIPTKNGNDIEFSAGTIWNLKLSDGTWIPDPYIGYDVSGNENHGTPTNVTKGTQDTSFYFLKYGFDRYTKKTTLFDVHDVPKTIVGDAIDVSATYPSETYDHVSHPAESGILPMGAIEFKPTDGENKISNGDCESGTTGFSGFGSTLAEETTIVHDGIKSIKVTSTADGTASQISQGKVVSSGTKVILSVWIYPIDVNEISMYLLSGTSLVNFTGLTLNEWNLCQTNVIELSGDSTFFRIYQYNDNGDIYYVDNMIVIDAEPTALEVYNRLNIIEEQSEYFREEIQELESYNPTYPWRHDANEFCLDYLMTYGTETLIKRLFLKQLKTDTDLVAISNILNYNDELSNDQRTMVLRFLKDPTKTDYEAWNIYKDSSVVCAFNFKDRFSLFNENGSLAELGWEGEDIVTNGTFDSDITGATVTTGTGGDAVLSQETVDPISGAGSLKLTQTASPSETNRPTITIALSEALTIGQRYSIDFDTKVISGTIKTAITYGVQVGYGGTGVLLNHTFSGTETYHLVHTPIEASAVLLIYLDGTQTAGMEFLIDNVVIKKIGHTVAKVLDVGSGNGSDTYYNALKSDLSKQPVRVAEGLEFDGVDDFLEADKSLFDVTKDYEVIIKFKADAVGDIHLISNHYASGNSIVIELYSNLIKCCLNRATGWIGKNTAFTDTTEWHVVKMQWDVSEDTITAYLDDVLMTGTGSPAYGVSGNFRTLIGARTISTPNLFFDGKIEYIKIRNSIT